ncbi:MAG: UTP--glucose-1-phosphate uridylyltransferase [Spirochaetia bacterium]|jgi:UDP-N-acetylglucosamine/UDP-N-acetylgalactosamine diphosphorylase
MRAWSIGEVARLLGVKPHVLRYWESELPLLSPKKGLSGRREYSANEVRLLMRFRHLLYDRKFTIEGAKRRMWEELGAGDPDISARFARIRSDLIEALMTARRGSTVPHGGEPMAHSDVRDRMEKIGQEHLFAFWEKRPESMRQRLLDDLSSLNLATVQELRRIIAEQGSAGVSTPKIELAPAPYVPLSESRADTAAREAGEEEIRRGRTAFLTVAGGQGSRLGFEGPKGMFPVTPLRKLTLFALFAEKLLAARRWYGADIPWLIMTGPQNHQATEEYFESEKWFGLGRDTVHLFMQGSLPSFSPEGRLLMAPDGGLFFNPKGHGGVIEALRQSGSLAAMREQRVEHLFYFQVDNPLVRVPDPVFLGFHCRARSRISAKVVEKAYPEEKLGIIVTADGRPSVIEYSDLDEARMRARGPDGRLFYGQGSIAIHILDVPFLESPGLHLPWHMARKNAKTLNPTAEGTEIQERDAVKMEMFVFDAIPLADRALFFETDRAEEFAPLKNREGQDSIASCLQGQLEQAARWLSGVGVEVPRDEQGRPRHAIEISPLFALDPRVLAARRGILKDRIDEDTVLA